ncbi:unnamed protein product [Brachionus calyciflorus]|uniref:tRNA/rRNA methyltransferase SpoU type domain-containing protein n=1 Tax=Brachionus calyciflorus TaxID=104777 RepID=A0A813M222_9BILA|nr:unnamed protein product [Brachionus calyciflorus]
MTQKQKIHIFFFIKAFGKFKLFQTAENVNTSDFITKFKNKHILNRKIEKLSSKSHQKTDHAIKDLMSLSKKLINSKNSALNPRNNLILLEGKILLKEALKTDQIQIEKIFYSDENLLQDKNLYRPGLIYHKISQELMETISDVKTNQGILAFGKLSLKPSLNKKKFSVILDQVSDPGNMGTIIRTAAAIGCDQIIMTKGSANPWNPKVLRSAMGGHFHLIISQNFELDEIKEQIPIDTKIIIADSKDSDNTIDYLNLETHLNLNKNDKICLVIGNEAHGVSNFFYALKNIGYNIFRTKIPILMDSLNCSVAFAILAFELKRILNKK